MEKAIKIFQRPTVEDPYGIGNKNYNDQREFSFSKLICFIHVLLLLFQLFLSLIQKAICLDS